MVVFLGLGFLEDRLPGEVRPNYLRQQGRILRQRCLILCRERLDVGSDLVGGGPGPTDLSHHLGGVRGGRNSRQQTEERGMPDAVSQYIHGCFTFCSSSRLAYSWATFSSWTRFHPKKGSPPTPIFSSHTSKSFPT